MLGLLKCPRLTDADIAKIRQSNDTNTWHGL